MASLALSLVLLCCGVMSSPAQGARLAEEEGANPSEQVSPAPTAPAAPSGPAPARPSESGPRRSPPVPASTGPAQRVSSGPSPSAPAAANAAENRRPSSSDRITINFDNADLRTVVKFISELTGRNFLVDDKVKGTVTILSPSEITVEEAYRIFLSVLEMKGFTVVDAGAVTKIIPSTEARQKDITTLKLDGLGQIGREDRIVTGVVPLNFANANDLKGILSPLVSKESQIAAYMPTNTLVITDYASNIHRLMGIIRDLDVEGVDEKITVVPLKYASAQVLASELLALMDKGAQQAARRTTTTQPARPGVPAAPQPGVPQPAAAPTEGAVISASKIIADERTNSLIIIASATDTQKIMGLIEKLDTPLPPGRKRIHVYFLEYAKAEEIMQVLAQLSGRGTGAMPLTGTTRTGTGIGTTGLGTTGLGTLGHGTTGLGTGTLGTTGLGTAGTRTGVSGTTSALTGVFGGGLDAFSKSVVLGEDVQVVADKPTNSLVIVASPTDYETLKEVIEKLDVMRPQVLVEALIAEVSLTKSKSLGVEWQWGEQLTGGRETGVRVGTGGADVGATLGAVAQQLVFGIFKGPITVAGQSFPNLRALIRAMQSASDVNILSTPHVLTLNNEEAEIVVAQNIPFLKSQTGTAESTTTTTPTPTTAVLQTFEFKDVGIVLRITPQISRGKFVRLNIFQEVSDVGAAERLTTTPTTFKRQAKTTVVVENSQTVVIGGLIQDTQRQTTSGVPCLASVPILGNLFRSQGIGPNEKRNLLIFITPHIVNTPAELAEITERMREGREKDKEEFEEWRSKDFEETMDLLLR